MLPCLSFRTVASRKLTELVGVSCVNLIKRYCAVQVVNEFPQGVYVSFPY